MLFMLVHIFGLESPVLAVAGLDGSTFHVSIDTGC